MSCVVGDENDINVCQEQKRCGKCISLSPDCHWCLQKVRRLLVRLMQQNQYKYVAAVTIRNITQELLNYTAPFHRGNKKRSFHPSFSCRRCLCVLQDFTGSRRCDFIENLMSNNCSSVYGPHSSILYYRVFHRLHSVDKTKFSTVSNKECVINCTNVRYAVLSATCRIYTLCPKKVVRYNK